MNDPYNSAVEPTDDAIPFERPSAEETARFRRLIDLHRELPAEYQRQRRGELANPAA